MQHGFQRRGGRFFCGFGRGTGGEEIDVQVGIGPGELHETAWETRVAGRGRPVPALAAGLAGLSKQWSENNTISAAGKGLGNIAGVFKLGIGDDVYVAAAGLVEVCLLYTSDAADE